jgi:hypothetical protein
MRRSVSEHCGSRSLDEGEDERPSARPMGVSASSWPTHRAAARSNRESLGHEDQHLERVVQLDGL